MLADWNGLMIAALANAGTMLGEPAWIEMAARAFDVHCAQHDQGRPARAIPGATGRLLYPGLASDFANMIRAALALYEATGQGALSRAGAGLAARASTRTTPIRTTAAISSPPSDAEGLVVRPALDQRRRHAQSECDRRAEPGAARGADRRRAWREQADRLFDGVLAGAADNLLQHAALLNALDLRLHAAEIVVTGPDHARFAAAALKLPYPQPDRAARAGSADALPASHPAQAKIAAAAGRARRSSASARPARCR